MSTKRVFEQKPVSDVGSPFLFLSNLLERPVVDASGRSVGRLEDLSVNVTEPFPPVRQCILRQPWPSELRLACRWSDVADYRAKGIRLSVTSDQLIPNPPEVINEIRLRRDVLDKQVVDTNGLKIIRVNDVHFLIAESTLRAVHVDIGFRALVRRLGWEKGLDWAFHKLLPFASYRSSDMLVSWRYVETLSPAASHQHLHLSLSRSQLPQAHPTDIADMLGDLDPSRRLRLFRALGYQTRAQTLAQLPSDVRARLLEMVPHEETAQLLNIMPPDEAADILGEVPNDVRQLLVNRMKQAEASKVQSLLAYPPGTAGALMTTNFITLSEDLTIGQALERLRALAPSADTIYYIYVLDPAEILVGVLSLRTLISEAPTTPLSQVMIKRPVSVLADDSLAECAALVAKYKLLAVPVLRADRTMIGVITVDDVLGEVIHFAWTRKFTQR